MPIRHFHQCKCESRKSTQCPWKSITYFTLSQIHIIFLFPCRFLASDLIHWFLYRVSLDSYLLFRFSLHCFRSPALFFSLFFLPLFFHAICLFGDLLVSFRKHFCLFKRYQFGSKNSSCFSFPLLPILVLFKGMEFSSNLIFSHIFN